MKLVIKYENQSYRFNLDSQWRWHMAQVKQKLNLFLIFVHEKAKKKQENHNWLRNNKYDWN